MEKPVQSSVKVCLGILSKDGNVSPPMAMFMASQPYFWQEFDCKIFDARMGAGWFDVYSWMSRQDSDYYVFMDASMCPDPYTIERLVSRQVDVVVPPVWEVYNGTKRLNAVVGDKYLEKHQDCGFQKCDNSTLSIVCISRKVLTMLLMAMEIINDSSLLAPIKTLGFPIFIDWTISPSYRWEDESREYGNRMLQAYGLWYSRIKRGLSIGGATD